MANGSDVCPGQEKHLQGTNISPQKWHFEDDFPNFPRWDMLIPWRVHILDIYF